MPRFDGTGPMGLGPGTGWGRGPCGAGLGRGYGRGFGWRRFRGYGSYAYPYQAQISRKEEKEILEDEVAGLEEELKAVKTRLTELKGQKIK